MVPEEYREGFDLELDLQAPVDHLTMGAGR